VTTFQQVLYLTSDNLPLQDPSILFNSTQFQQHGFLIWPDFWHDLWMWPAVYRLLGLQAPWEEDPLALAAGPVNYCLTGHGTMTCWNGSGVINTHAELVYKCVVGDKDTVQNGLRLGGQEQTLCAGQRLHHPVPAQLGAAAVVQNDSRLSPA